MPGARYFRHLIIGSAFVLAIVSPAAADDAKPLPNIDRLRAAVEAIVSRHYPEARITATPHAISFEHNTREFLIHVPYSWSS